ncbi:hypothetical protein FMEAI12_3330009 [Parafrankia sp. Ea1.12]|nr:hypothetical protein FMEAI12_3330009 [Parafrankia sp. Ea1.12]
MGTEPWSGRRGAARPSASAAPLTARSMNAADPTSVRRIRPCRRGRGVVIAGRPCPAARTATSAPARAAPHPCELEARRADPAGTRDDAAPGGRLTSKADRPAEAPGRDGDPPGRAGRPVRTRPAWRAGETAGRTDLRGADPSATKPLAIAGILRGAGGAGRATWYSRAPRLSRVEVNVLGRVGVARAESRALSLRCSATSA